MKVHFQRAIWPLTVTAALFGFALIEYPVGKPQRFLSFLYAAVVISIQVGLFVIKKTWVSELATFGNTVFIQSVSDIFSLGCCFISILSICLTHWQGKRYYRCVEAIHEVDETLRNLGIETDYSKLRRVVVACVITWVSWCCLLNIFDSTLLSKFMTAGLAVLFPILLDTPLHIPVIIDIYFWCVVGYAGSRLDCVKSALRRLVLDDNDYVGWCRNNQMTSFRKGFVPDEKNKRIIWTMMHLHFQLCQILRDMHQVFEVQISFEMSFCSVYILGSMIFTFRMVLLPFDGDKFETAAVIWVWTIVFFVKIFITNYICETIGAKATSVCDMTVRLLRVMDDEKMCEDVSLIVLQTKHHPLRFSNMGTCYFGYQFMYEIFGSMVTMLVIILQLKTGLEAE